MTCEHFLLREHNMNSSQRLSFEVLKLLATSNDLTAPRKLLSVPFEFSSKQVLFELSVQALNSSFLFESSSREVSIETSSQKIRALSI